MNRLQKKCTFVAFALHALLVCVVLFGSAFFNSEPKEEKHVELTAFDPNLINDIATKGGNPNVATAPPPPAPAVTHTAPEVPHVQEPPKTKEVVHDEPKPPIKKDFSDEAPKPPKHREVLTAAELKLNKSKPVKIHKEHKQTSDSQSQSEDQEAVQNAIHSLNSSIKSLNHNLSTSTTVELKGPGGGGPLSANFRDILANKYDSAWASPPDLSDESAKVTISVTIARDGHVINGRIMSSSHNVAMDRSIQNLLDTVTFVAPFPHGWNESERSFEIVLSLKSKH